MGYAFKNEIVFRCPPELEGVLPRPIPAVEGLPDWFKAMPRSAFSELSGTEQFTVKKCPPFIDAMTCGYLMPLVADVHVKDGVFTWDRDVPGGALSSYPRSPLDLHENTQVAGTPFYGEDQFILKFTNFWTIELPPGYSALITHPANRADLPFLTLSGLVDVDRYRDTFVHFPARWLDPSFEGVLPRGTPVAQCIPVRRDTWETKTEVMDAAAADRLRATRGALQAERGVYRREFRAPKR